MRSLDLLDYFLLGLFCLFIGVFLFRNKKNLNSEGIMLLYRTQVGVKIIEYIGGKFKRTLGFFKYIIIAVGYFLMVGIIYLIGKSAYIYITQPILVTKLVKAPPIAPVIPYFPKIFGMESFFPPFYFTYFLVALAIVAIVHEFSHGIYMKFNKVRIKSTGIVFLGPILGAFVEQNDKDLEKRSKTGQMSILAAGVFANMIFAGIFFLLWMGLFFITFSPTGAMFDTYAQGVVNVSSITMVGGIIVTNHTGQEIINIIDKGNLTNDLLIQTNDGQMNFTRVIASNKTFYMTPNVLKTQLQSYPDEALVYPDLPAIKAGLRGTIFQIDQTQIKNHDDLVEILKNYQPGDKIEIKTNFNGQILTYDLVVGSDPNNMLRPMIGIGNMDKRTNIAENFAFFKNQFTDYKVNSDILYFLYYLCFWVFLINLLVGFFNMLPASILDGGRFFYLTIWGITKNEKIAKSAYKWAGIIILGVFILMMIAWTYGIVNHG